MGPSRLWPVSDVHCKIQTCPLIREGALHEERITCQTKEHVGSGHGPQRAARHQDILVDLRFKFSYTPPREVSLCSSRSSSYFQLLESSSSWSLSQQFVEVEAEVGPWQWKLEVGRKSGPRRVQIERDLDLVPENDNPGRLWWFIVSESIF
jgi:hypothetical protein